MSCHQWESIGRCFCPQSLLRHLFLSTQIFSQFPLKSLTKTTLAAVNLFSVEGTSFSLSLDRSGGKFRCFSDQNSSSKPRVRHSLLKELNLAMSDLTQRKWKLYHRIRRKESALCKLRKYRSRNVKDLCDVDRDPLMQEISNSLNAEAVSLLAAIIRNCRHKPREKRWNF